MGNPTGNEDIYRLIWADGPVVLAEDEDDLSYMMCKLEDQYSKSWLAINIGKTEYLAIQREMRDIEFENEMWIKATNKLKYLVFTITNETSTEEELNTRVEQIQTSIKQLTRSLALNKLQKL